MGILQILRAAARRLPVSAERKGQVLVFLFHCAPFLVSWTRTYKDWNSERVRIAERRAELDRLSSLYPGGRDFAELSALLRPKNLMVRAIAFYLPQFHPIPENDAWWGKGFTEWTNVRRARPLFESHSQPRRPGELGYYDLVEQPHIQRRQAALAYQYGLEGFCFYAYWFAGKRLLETPVEAYADDAEITFPYCLCWANEPWSRRWDGREDQVLMAQEHSPADDIAFIREMARHLRNPKYLKVGKRPLLIVYRPGILPDPKATVQRWRKWCRENGIGEIYVAYTQSFDAADPAEFGMDAAIEFPPNNMGLAPQDDLVAPIGPETFAAKIYDYKDLQARTLAPLEVSYTLHRGVTPQWDNTARRGISGTVFVNSGPHHYTQSLASVVLDTATQETDPDKRLVFINAWNEWAEGAYLEPDEIGGYRWLEATREALRGPGEDNAVEPGMLVPLDAPVPVKPARKIIVVVHDLHPHGAQFLSLSFARSLNTVFGYEVTVLACGDGVLGVRFETYGALIGVSAAAHGRDALVKNLRRLAADGYACAIVNSSASGWIVPHLADAGIRSVGLVHELPVIAQDMGLEPNMQAMNEHCRHVIFASSYVAEANERDTIKTPWQRPVILPQGLYKADAIVDLEQKQQAAEAVRQELGVGGEAQFVVGVGYGDHRKGVDIFIDWAVATVQKDPAKHFIWLGKLSPEMTAVCEQKLGACGEAAANVHVLGFREDTGPYYRAASLYALSSREDPFPSTPLEAMAAGTPVIMVAGTGGLIDLVETGGVFALPDDDPDSFADFALALLDDGPRWEAAAAASLETIQSRFGFTSFVGDVLRLLGEPIPKISVIVPNFNYARYLPHRLSSIFNQSVPVWEIVFLDDASSDDSLTVARQLLQNCPIRYRIISNEENSGSVFKQWRKGVELASGDLVWMAEADDWAARDFVESVSPGFEQAGTVISFAQSHQVDATSAIIACDYLDYVRDISPTRWRRAFAREGREELAQGFSVKNTIPNVSAALFDRVALTRVLQDQFDEICSYRVAGDWCVYAHLLLSGGLAFEPRPLNYHRRHTSSVTISQFTRREWDEIASMQARVAELVTVPAPLTDIAQAYLDHLKLRLSSEPGTGV